jgi:hypothetical protein
VATEADGIDAVVQADRVGDPERPPGGHVHGVRHGEDAWTRNGGAQPQGENLGRAEGRRIDDVVEAPHDGDAGGPRRHRTGEVRLLAVRHHHVDVQVSNEPGQLPHPTDAVDEEATSNRDPLAPCARKGTDREDAHGDLCTP